MSGRRHRVLGTTSASYRLEVATGGKPVTALLRALERMPVGRGQVWATDVHHDDECPALGTGPMHVCTCEVVDIAARRVA